LPKLSGLMGSLFESAALDDDGRLVAAAVGNTLGVWEVKTGKQLWMKPGLPSLPHALAFSNRGDDLAVGTLSGTVSIWRVNTGQEEPLHPGNAGAQRAAVKEVKFSANGQLLAVHSEDQTVLLWNIPGKQLQASLSHGGAVISALAFSSDSEMVATAATDGRIN